MWSVYRIGFVTKVVYVDFKEDVFVLVLCLICIINIKFNKEDSKMYNLYEHLPNGKQILIGEYESCAECYNEIVIRMDIIQRLGYDKAGFHCEKAEIGRNVVGWIYGDDEEVTIWR